MKNVREYSLNAAVILSVIGQIASLRYVILDIKALNDVSQFINKTFVKSKYHKIK